MERIETLIAELRTAIPWKWVLLGFLAIEVLSFAAHTFPFVNTITFLVLIVVSIILAITNLRYALLALFAELSIGSFGYLVFGTISGTTISLRLVLFCSIMLGYVWQLLRTRSLPLLHLPQRAAFYSTLAVIAVGIINGLLRGNTPANIFFDVNGYLFLALLLPLAYSITTRTHIVQILAIIIAGNIILISKTLVLLILFSHMEAFPFTIRALYLWIRDMRLGEITRFPNGFSRIFFQSQLYVIASFLGAFAVGVRFLNLHNIWRRSVLLRGYALFSMTGLIIFLSYSRSFWIGSIGTIVLFMGMLFMKRALSARRIAATIGIVMMTGIVDYGLALGLVNIPLPGYIPIRDLFSQRTQDLFAEPAAASRFQLLKPLVASIRAQPLIGYGFGKTLTYHSQDPRILAERPDGTVTTFAFEWGVFDMVLKVGLLGVAAFAWWYARTVRALWNAMFAHDAVLPTGFFVVLVGIALIHIFTPYLNHPLGLSLFLLGICVSQLYERSSRNTTL